MLPRASRFWRVFGNLKGHHSGRTLREKRITLINSQLQNLRWVRRWWWWQGGFTTTRVQTENIILLKSTNEEAVYTRFKAKMNKKTGSLCFKSGLRQIFGMEIRLDLHYAMYQGRMLVPFSKTQVGPKRMIVSDGVNLKMKIWNTHSGARRPRFWNKFFCKASVCTVELMLQNWSSPNLGSITHTGLLMYLFIFYSPYFY